MSPRGKTGTSAPAVAAAVASGNKACNCVAMWAILREIVRRLAQETIRFDGLAPVGVPECDDLLRGKWPA